MKKLVFFFLLISFTASAQKIDKNKMYAYSETVDFRIYAIQKSRTADRNQQILVARKGRRFYTIIFEFKNNSSETHIIDFEKILMKDKNSNLNRVDLVVMAGKMTSTIKRFQQKLKSNKKRKIIAQFESPLPKDDLVKYLIVNGNLIELEYN